MLWTWDGYKKGQYQGESYPHVGKGSGSSLASEDAAIFERKELISATEGVSTVAEEVLGGHVWSRGYFGATVGAVTEEQIKQYIEGQGDEDKGFKVWDEQQDADKEGPSLQSDSSEWFRWLSVLTIVHDQSNLPAFSR
jgi:hypothetical protein